MPGAEKYNRSLRLEKNSGPAIGRGFDFSHLHHPTPGFRWKPGVSVPGSGRRACRDLVFADFPAGIIEAVEEDVSSSQKVSRTCE